MSKNIPWSAYFNEIIYWMQRLDYEGKTYECYSCSNNRHGKVGSRLFLKGSDTLIYQSIDSLMTEADCIRVLRLGAFL
jgi:hypothetical protein